MRLLLLISLAVTACTQFPELDATLTPQADAANYPELGPIPGYEQTQQPGSDVETEEKILQSRLQALRARAQALRNRSL